MPSVINWFPCLLLHNKRWLAAAPLVCLDLPADSCAGSFRRRCSLSRRESSCFLCAWMLLHVSDMTSWAQTAAPDTDNGPRFTLFRQKLKPVRLLGAKNVWYAAKKSRAVQQQLRDWTFRLTGAVQTNTQLWKKKMCQWNLYCRNDELLRTHLCRPFSPQCVGRERAGSKSRCCCRNLSWSFFKHFFMLF